MCRKLTKDQEDTILDKTLKTITKIEVTLDNHLKK